MGDGHVVRVVDGRIDSLADHAQLPPCGVEGVVNLTPGRVVGHLVTDENANAHVRLTSYRPYVAKAFFNIASEWNVSLRLAVAPAWPAEPVAIIQQDRLRIDTRKWMAARLAPKKYGERISHDIKGPGPNFQPAILITVDGLTHGYEATREAAMAGSPRAGGGSRGGSNQHPASSNVKTARSRRGIVPFTHLAREGRMTVTIGRRELLVAFGGAAAAWPLAARAQQAAMPVAGPLSGRSPKDSAANVIAFQRGLGELGYFDGQNVEIDFRWALGHYDQLPALAADLVRRKVALIVA